MGIQILLHLTVMLVLAPLLFGIIGKTKALFAGRWGAPLFQPYYDIIKFFKKGNVYSTTTTWIFQVAPLVYLATILVSSLLIPFGGLKAPVYFWGDFILFIYISGLSRYFIIIGALDTGSSFEGMGASREATFSCLAEIVLALDFIILAILSKQLILSEMVGGTILSSWPLFGPVLLLVGLSYFLVLLVESARIPIDDPTTHLELTMIHEVMFLDHSGWDLACVSYASMMKFFVLGSLFVNILIPFHNLSAILQTVVFGVGMIGLAIIVGIVESCIARLRLNRIPELIIGAFVLALVGLLIILIKGV
ncbi:MAG: NADH-quinone oxidoreductase subunit H [Candidatus Omnitrophica bacterium]|nr:NADH-quinone oxidoreductase subunit H [Candidatus Omnitrophota bacterium]